MAVARVTADKRWLKAAIRAMADHQHAVRELTRAIDRPGRTAELNADEVRALAERLPNDAYAQRMLTDVVESEERDRVRRDRVQALMNLIRENA